ncbi:MAG: T9SS type A sorting domain-containing protein, partial [Ignavibacteriaceae bacterium]|nr:T9SS type A sorting domain-containing protein [Ignavibacteriaceae bacterium]
IDADDNVNTGYIYQDSASVGAEFMVENDNLWKYTGTGGANWGWAQASGFDKANNGNRSEMSIPLSVLKSANNSIRIIFQDNSSVSPYNLMEIDPTDYKTQYYSYKISTVTDVKDKNAITKITYKLSQNYPNPFNPSTIINYQLSDRNNVSIKIYNLLGQEIETLINKVQPAGKYSVAFNSSANGIHLSSGVYFYRLQAGNYIETKKMILLK